MENCCPLINIYLRMKEKNKTERHADVNSETQENKKELSRHIVFYIVYIPAPCIHIPTDRTSFGVRRVIWENKNKKILHFPYI